MGVKYSWEAFNDDIAEEPCSSYLSEAGSSVYDAVLELVAEKGVDHRVVQMSAIISVGLNTRACYDGQMLMTCLESL